jgi:hypothetical protein
MRLLGSIFFIAILIFLKIFYNSFMFGNDIYLFSNKVSNLDFLVTFYIYLTLTLYLLIKKFNLELVPLHLLFSISLLIAGEHTYSLFLQFVFLFILFDVKGVFLKTIFLSIYLLALHKALLLLFASSYLLYFIDLSLLVYTIFTKKELFKNLIHKYILVSVVVIVLVSSIFIFQNFIFDFYIWLDIIDMQKYLSSEVFYPLSLVHILIFTAIINQIKIMR